MIAECYKFPIFFFFLQEYFCLYESLQRQAAFASSTELGIWLTFDMQCRRSSGLPIRGVVELFVVAHHSCSYYAPMPDHPLLQGRTAPTLTLCHKMYVSHMQIRGRWGLSCFMQRGSIGLNVK